LHQNPGNKIAIDARHRFQGGGKEGRFRLRLQAGCLKVLVKEFFELVVLRDRALLAYTFARVGAVVNLKVEDYYPSGKRFLLR
jgi:hypothetical protein